MSAQKDNKSTPIIKWPTLSLPYLHITLPYLHSVGQVGTFTKPNQRVSSVQITLAKFGSPSLATRHDVSRVV